MAGSKKRRQPSDHIENNRLNQDYEHFNTSLNKTNPQQRRRATARRGADLDISKSSKSIKSLFDEKEREIKLSCLNRCFIEKIIETFLKDNKYNFSSLFEQYKHHLDSFSNKSDDFFENILNDLKKNKNNDDTSKEKSDGVFKFEDIFKVKNNNDNKINPFKDIKLNLTNGHEEDLNLSSENKKEMSLPDILKKED